VSETHYLGAAGMPGIAAKVPIDEACKGMETEGKTALVTGAAGAVGSLVVQLLRRLGMRVVACAGTQEKCDVVTGLGASACWNYRKETDPSDALAKHAPQGIDFFFDNVGGAILDAALLAMNKNGTILACGAISGYDQAPVPLQNWFHITVSRLKVQGFIASDFIASGAAGEATIAMAALLAEGSIVANETLMRGKFEEGLLPRAFCGLFRGDNTGKLIAVIQDEE